MSKYRIYLLLGAMTSYLIDYVYIHIYNSKSLDVVQSLYFGSKLPKYRDCTTSNDLELYFMCCGVMLLLLIMYIYIYTYTYIPS